VPRVTVHIPCYNYGHFVTDAIQSVLDQTFEDWEAIVVDDASTDRTSEILAVQDDPRLRVVRHEENVGNIGTYNEAIRAARGEFFVILSADDRYRPRFLERVLDIFSEHPEAGVVYTNYRRVDGSGRALPWRPPMPHDADGIFDELPSLLERSYIAGCSAVARVRTLRAMGMYDPRFPYTADTYLWRQIAAMAPFGYVDEPLYEYRAHESHMSLGRDRARILETEHMMHLDLILSDPRTPARIRADRNHFYAELYWSIAAWYAKTGRRSLAVRRLAKAISLEPTVWMHHGIVRRTWNRAFHPSGAKAVRSGTRRQEPRMDPQDTEREGTRR
jgi:glycosyltransferase involved in cell wall biosynthesis